MRYSIEVYPLFEREAKRLSKHYASFKSDLEILRNELLNNPQSGTSLGLGLYKVRMRIESKGKGKSGGARVIYMLVNIDEDRGEIGLHYIYDKSECANLTSKEIAKIIKENLK